MSIRKLRILNDNLDWLPSKYDEGDFYTRAQTIDITTNRRVLLNIGSKLLLKSNLIKTDLPRAVVLAHGGHVEGNILKRVDLLEIAGQEAVSTADVSQNFIVGPSFDHELTYLFDFDNREAILFETSYLEENAIPSGTKIGLLNALPNERRVVTRNNFEEMAVIEQPPTSKRLEVTFDQISDVNPYEATIVINEYEAYTVDWNEFFPNNN
jgi:hypothetical protein